ncbi:hypothetical protein DSO57_1009058 [Entomophthora muscae]|uniref:Uncharacterized protein n=1 Tax=Entomophthora muscae TaxID=34485 RepID=A0ACC2RLJ5_9FUNG|nr:hypothetical protein DSO57_1009058 [Entomophthora muscae]
MKLWFTNLFPYLFLILFHLHTPKRQYPSTVDKTEAFDYYRPPNALFGPVHFTEYPATPDHKPWTLEDLHWYTRLNAPKEPYQIVHDGKAITIYPLIFNGNSLKADQTLQDSPGPANLLSHRLKLLNYPATCRHTTEDSLNSCQSATKLVPMKTHIYKGDVTWLTEVGEGPTASLPRANTGVSKSTLETLESTPDPPKATQVTQNGQEPAHLLNCKPKLSSYSEARQSPKDNSPNGHQIDANLEPQKI